MGQKYSIIHLNGLMYAVENDITKLGHVLIHTVDGWILRKAVANKGGFMELENGSATLPFEDSYKPIVMSSNPSIGLPLLPAVNNINELVILANDSVTQAKSERIVTDGKTLVVYTKGFAEGYKTAKAKKYSEEDMIKGMLWAMSTRESNAKKLGKLTLPETEQEEQQFEKDFMGRYNMGEALISKFLQSLNPLPIAVEVEMMEGKVVESVEFIGDGADIEWNKQPKVDANNFVNPLKWIYHE